MVSHCLACAEPFLKLNQGKIVSLEVSSTEVEFFWLCHACAALCDVVIRNGSPVVVPRDDRPAA
jgi:hypothetical protein